MSSATTINNLKKSVRLCCLGDGGAGKTALTIQFISNHFVEYYDPTIEDSYRRQCLIDNEIVCMEILDTAGQDEYCAMRDQWIRECDGFIIIYSINSRLSFDQVQFFKDQINRVLDKDDVPIMLVGNKSDLERERQVSKQEGIDLARCLKMSFLETSAKTRTNVEEAFHETVRCVSRKQQEEQSLKNNKKIHNNNNSKNSIFKKLNNKVNSTKTSICKMM